MSESSAWQAVTIPLLTTALTVACSVLLLVHQENRADRERFIDGAQTTAQETAHLLDEGYLELSKLINASGNQGWKDFSKSSSKPYWDFSRRWERQLITQHFKLSRYFGKDMADQLTHVDEIDLHPIDNLGSPHLCTPPGGENDFDIVKLADQTECFTRLIAGEQDIITGAKNAPEKDAGQFMDAIQESQRIKDFAAKLLQQYHRASVSYLRQLDNRLTQLGQPHVAVKTRDKS